MQHLKPSEVNGIATYYIIQHTACKWKISDFLQQPTMWEIHLITCQARGKESWKGAFWKVTLSKGTVPWVPLFLTIFLLKWSGFFFRWLTLSLELDLLLYSLLPVWACIHLIYTKGIWPVFAWTTSAVYKIYTNHVIASPFTFIQYLQYMYKKCPVVHSPWVN